MSTQLNPFGLFLLKLRLKAAEKKSKHAGFAEALAAKVAGQRVQMAQTARHSHTSAEQLSQALRLFLKRSVDPLLGRCQVDRTAAICFGTLHHPVIKSRCIMLSSPACFAQSYNQALPVSAAAHIHLGAAWATDLGSSDVEHQPQEHKESHGRSWMMRAQAFWELGAAICFHAQLVLHRLW